MKCILKPTILLLFFLTVIALPVFSKGQNETTDYTLADAQALAEERNYDEAIKILVVIVRSDPEQMEEAQKLINDIKRTRDTYNAKYEELITVLFEDENYERSLELIAELEQLDANPNETTQDSIREARISAELVYFRQVFNDIMDRGQVYLSQQQYTEAVNIYTTGFNLYRRTFDETEYGNIIKDPIYREIEVLNSSIASFRSETVNLDNSFQRAVNVWENGSVEAALQETDALTDEIQRFSTYSARIYQSGNVFVAQNQRIQALGEEFREDFFLSFMSLIINGRKTVDTREGISTAMNLYWEDQLLSLLETASRRSENAWEDGLVSYGNENWTAASSQFETAGALAYETEKLSALVRSGIRFDPATYQTDLQSRDIITTFSPYFEKGRFINKASQAFLAYSSIQQSLDELETVDRNDYEALLGVAVSLNDNLNDLTDIKSDWLDYSAGEDQNPLIADSPVLPLAEIVLASADNVENDYLAYKSDIITALAQLDMNPLSEQYQTLSTQYATAQNFISGLQDDDVPFKYPRRGVEILDEIDPASRLLVVELQNYREKYENEAATIQDSQRIGTFLSQASAMIEDLSAWETAILTYRSQAEDNIFEAENRVAEGNLFYTNAQQSLNRNDFELAEDQKTQSYSLYLEALSYDEDVLDREAMVARNAALSQAIFNDWNQYVLLTVRDLLGEGRGLYYQGSFTRSETVLLEAERLWSQTNTEENQEIIRWLNLVNNALSANYGRTVNETDPLYGEINQLLNLAYMHYDSGNDYIDRGNITDGLKELDLSDRYIKQVIDILPINQEASILNLKVEYARDPQVAESIFREMFTGALQKSRTGNNDQLIEAYRDLQDLSGVRPNYPGLANAIYETEIALGIRIRPPDPAILAQSNALYNRALAIYQNGNRNQFPAAVTLLNDSLELNPENTAASDLIIDIQIVIGTDNTTVALSPDDQALFNQAEDYYINGQYFVANSIVEQLLAKGNNNRYPPLIELKRRIDSKI